MDDQSPVEGSPDTSFVPSLDARQRAMLAEMGVRVWAPRPRRPQRDAAVEPAVASASEPPPLQAAVASPPVAPVGRAVPPPLAPAARDPAASPSPSPSPSPALQPLPDGLAAMDWGALATAASGCQACGLCQRRKNTVWGMGDAQADWLVVGDPPSEEDEVQGRPFAGPAGELLDNMLRAVGVGRERGAYVTSVTKCRPPSRAIPSAQELAQCSAYLAREVALVKPKVIIAMGRFALEVLTQSRDHLGKLRGRAHAFEGVPVIATYHPNALLRTQSDKAKAWADLCLAMTVAAQAPQA